MTYRPDVDGLRAVAVTAVMLFHCGGLPNGYLGVDVFFVISGYLITQIINREMGKGSFGFGQFCMRRARRILPLSLVVALATAVVGMVCMLPDDLENLGQSVVATNLCANNLLQAITTRDYWDVVNEYKPLMHTWSLGVEEQFYVLYPALFVVARRGPRRLLLGGVLMALGAVSVALTWSSWPEWAKFYLLPFRFYELAAGGLVAISLRDRLLSPYAGLVPLFALLGILAAPPGTVPERLLVPSVVALACWLMATANDRSFYLRVVLSSVGLVAIGRISFSLYMWHQPVLAFMRYAVVQQPGPEAYIGALIITFLLSGATYRFVEQPFRNHDIVPRTLFVSSMAVGFAVATALGLYLHVVGGVVRDVPELGIEKRGPRVRHGAYNSRVRTLSGSFSADSDKLRILVVGNSFARDWVNVLLESRQASNFEISYVESASECHDFTQRLDASDLVFHSPVARSEAAPYLLTQGNVFIVGTKNFGCSAGYFYNYRGPHYFAQRTEMENGYAERNAMLHAEWGNQYIDLIAAVVDREGRMPVFTPGGMFISQDCRHLTEAGAAYFAEVLATEIDELGARAQGRRAAP
jgi:peptidoglycan/LPS O-acetylase OafA/YrhL